MVVIFCGQKLLHLLPKHFEHRFNSNLANVANFESNCNCNHYICFQEVIGIVMITFGKKLQVCCPCKNQPSLH